MLDMLRGLRRRGSAQGPAEMWPQFPPCLRRYLAPEAIHLSRLPSILEKLDQKGGCGGRRHRFIQAPAVASSMDWEFTGEWERSPGPPRLIIPQEPSRNHSRRSGNGQMIKRRLFLLQMLVKCSRILRVMGSWTREWQLNLLVFCWQNLAICTVLL